MHRSNFDKISEELYQKEIPGIIVSFNSGQKDRLNRGYQEVMKKLQEFKAAHQNINNQDCEPLEMKLKEFTEGMSKIQNKLETSLALANFQKEELLKQINQQETQISTFLKELESQRSVSKSLSEKLSMQEAYECIDELLKEEQKKVALLKKDLKHYETKLEAMHQEDLEKYENEVKPLREKRSELNCRLTKVEESYKELSLTITKDYDKLILHSFVNQMEVLFAWIFNHHGNVMYPQEISYAFKYQNKEALFKKLDLNTREQVSKLKTNMICLKQPNEFAHIPIQNKINMSIEELKLASNKLGEERRLVNLLDIWEKALEPESKIFDQSTWRLKSSFY